MKLHASCLCGHIQVDARQQPLEIGYCHCSMCRKHTGAPFTSFSVFRDEDITFQPVPSLYSSSASAQRGFCPKCGTSISWHGKAWDRNIIAIQTGLFDQAETLTPTQHWYVGSCLPWVNLNDDLIKSNAL